MAFVTKTVTIRSGTAVSQTIYPQDISNNGLLVFCGVYCPSSVDAATTRRWKAPSRRLSLP